MSSWDTLGNWSTAAVSGTAPSVKPGSSDDIVFNVNAKNGQNSMVSLSANNQSAASLTFSSTGATVFVRSSSTNSASVNLTIGSGGMTVSSTAGPVTFGEADKKVSVKLSSTAAFTNNSSSLVTFVKSVEPTTAIAAGVYTLTLAGSGTGGFRFDDVIGNNATTGTLALAVNTAASALTVLGTANTFAGGVTITQGVLGVGSATALGTGAVTINGGALASVTSARTLSNTVAVGGNFTLGGLGQSITLNGPVNLGGSTRTITLGNSATINGAISNGGLALTGSSGGNVRRLTLNGTNTYSGGSTVNSGTLIAGGTAAFGSGSVTVAADAVLDLGGYAISNDITNNGGTILNAASYSGTQTLLASATFSSLGGNLRVGSAGKAKLTGSIAATVATLAGGTAELASGGSLTQATVANAGKFIVSSVTDQSLSTGFTGAGGFEKQGAGSILTLSGSSYFGAGTQITDGGMRVTGTVDGGAVTVTGNGSIGGTGRIGGSLVFQSGAVFNFAAGETLTVAGNTTFGGFGVANINGLSSSTPDGTYTLINGTVDFTNVTNVGASDAYVLGPAKAAYLQQGSLQLIVVPEPATVSLVASAAGAAVLMVRRRRSGA